MEGVGRQGGAGRGGQGGAYGGRGFIDKRNREKQPFIISFKQRILVSNSKVAVLECEPQFSLRTEQMRWSRMDSHRNVYIKDFKWSQIKSNVCFG